MQAYPCRADYYQKQFHSQSQNFKKWHNQIVKYVSAKKASFDRMLLTNLKTEKKVKFLPKHGVH